MGRIYQGLLAYIKWIQQILYSSRRKSTILGGIKTSIEPQWVRNLSFKMLIEPLLFKERTIVLAWQQTNRRTNLTFLTALDVEENSKYYEFTTTEIIEWNIEKKKKS